MGIVRFNNFLMKFVEICDIIIEISCDLRMGKNDSK